LIESILIEKDMLRRCLAVLTGEERDLIAQYYSDASPAARKALAEEKDISREHPSVRMFGIKQRIMDRLNPR
jgi:hypothetical protein